VIKLGVLGRAQRTGETLPPELLDAAEAVGAAIGASGAVLVSGGTGGVMEASARGARAEGGLTVGFLPQADPSHANPYIDLVFATGLGTVRNVLTARCSDCVIVVGGGVGTLNEITLAYDYAVPIVVLSGTGGWADRLRPVLLEGAYLDERKVVEITFAPTPADAVEQALRRAAEPRAGRTQLIGWAGQ
jgi:uncharacterized protein (TIGR00725 family)